MCASRLFKKILRDPIRIYIYLLLICIFFATVGSPRLSAQILDDFDTMKSYKLSAEAVLIDELSVVDSLMYHKGKAFTGTAFESYPDGQLYRVITYRAGFQHGPFMLWYSDGEPQLFTNYYRGAPHGRFVGWYTNGRLIYNIVLNRGRLGGDFLYEDDDSRQQTETETIEPEGTDND